MIAPPSPPRLFFVSMLTFNHCCVDSNSVLIVELKGLWVLTFDHHDDHYLE